MSIILIETLLGLSKGTLKTSNVIPIHLLELKSDQKVEVATDIPLDPFSAIHSGSWMDSSYMLPKDTIINYSV